VRIPGALPFGGIVIAATLAILFVSPQFPLSRAAIPLVLVAVVVIGIKLSTTEMLGGKFNLQRTYFDICLTLAGAMASLLIVQLFAGKQPVFPAAAILLVEIGIAPRNATRAVGILAVAASLVAILTLLLGILATWLENKTPQTPTRKQKSRYEFKLGACQISIVLLGSASFTIFSSAILLRS
jgi:hypothetical protein